MEQNRYDLRPGNLSRQCLPEQLKISQEAKDLLADKGYKPEFGARELHRVDERELEMKLAEFLLNGNNASNTLTARIENGHVVVTCL